MTHGSAGDELKPIVLARCATFRIGPVEARPAMREVIGPDARETIEPRVMQVLVALHQARGEIVSRDDLIRCCWDNRVVGDDAINRAISKIRRLGETVGKGAFGIETITKVGYRLMSEAPPAEVPNSEPPAAEPGGEAKPISPPPAKPGLSRRAMIGGGGAVAAATVAGSWWLLEGGNFGADDLPADDRAEFERGKALMDAGRFEDATAAFQRVADGAPDLADAWGWIALSMAMERASQPAQSADRADSHSRAAAERALTLDPRNTAALTAQALGFPIFGDWLNAETALRRVLEIDPRVYRARDWLTWILENVGRWRDSIDLLQPYAEQFELLSTTQFRLAISLWSVGRLADADRVIDRAMRRWPSRYGIWFTRYWLYVRSGRCERALAMSARGRRPPEIPQWNFDLNDLYTRAVLTRAPADVELAMAEHRRRAETGAGFCENAIQLAAQVDRLDEAFAWCDAYYFGRGFRVAATRFAQLNQTYTPPYLRRTAFLFTPILEPMRRDPRFANLMEETGLTSYWRRSGTRSESMT